MAPIFEIAAAIIFSLGGGAALVFALSSWLGKVWAGRILASDKQKYAHEMEEIRAKVNRSLKEYEIKTAAIQDERNKAILSVSSALSKAYIGIKMFCEFAQIIAGHQDLAEMSKESLTATDELQAKLHGGKLFFPKDLFDKLQAFSVQTRKSWITTTTILRTAGTSGAPLTPELREAQEKELQNLERLDSELEEILEQFRTILGTHV